LPHIVIRGIEGKAIFEDDTDRYVFIERLSRLLKETVTPCFAWALMNPPCASASAHGQRSDRIGYAPVFDRLDGAFQSRFQWRHRRHAHLFQNRYKSIQCPENSYLHELVRYTHLNPLRAKLVADTDALVKKSQRSKKK
jgi:hypothetical protein